MHSYLVLFLELLRPELDGPYIAQSRRNLVRGENVLSLMEKAAAEGVREVLDQVMTPLEEKNLSA